MSGTEDAACISNGLWKERLLARGPDFQDISRSLQTPDVLDPQGKKNGPWRDNGRPGDIRLKAITALVYRIDRG